MTSFRWILRFLAMLTLSLWLGGFTFYGGVVVPILDDALGHFDAGQITRLVTDRLNLIGLVTVFVWWIFVVDDRNRGLRSTRAARLLFLVATSLLLAFLAWMHVRMDHHLDRFGASGFRPLHRTYLMASTAQWLANLGLLATSTRDDSSRGMPS